MRYSSVTLHVKEPIFLLPFRQRIVVTVTRTPKTRIIDVDIYHIYYNVVIVLTYGFDFVYVCNKLWRGWTRIFLFPFGDP